MLLGYAEATAQEEEGKPVKVVANSVSDRPTCAGIKSCQWPSRDIIWHTLWSIGQRWCVSSRHHCLQSPDTPALSSKQDRSQQQQGMSNNFLLTTNFIDRLTWALVSWWCVDTRWFWCTLSPALSKKWTHSVTISVPLLCWLVDVQQERAVEPKGFSRSFRYFQQRNLSVN